ncbi:MAG: nucleoside:proton symporter [Pseudomonadota bacterium]|nr:MAG: nucleoside:proton symporter [Pseudomonadota bacterium]
MALLQGFFGIGVLLVGAWAFSEDRRRFPWRHATVGLAIMVALAAALLKLPFLKDFFLGLSYLLAALERATQSGTAFVFGYLGGAPLPFAESGPGSAFVLAFRALPLVLVVSALSALLFHWRILPWMVRGVARLLQKALGIGGALGVGAAANVFVGMVEAPLLVRPYLARMSRAELFAVMTCGMATIAGTVMVLYASLLGPVIPGAMGHILSASLLNMVAALVVAAIMIPPPAQGTAGDVEAPQATHGAMDAVTQGTLAGVQLLLNIVAMLVVLVALVSLTNVMLGLLPDIGGAPITLQRALGLIMAPVVWLAGVPWGEAQVAGGLMGTKTILNELLAYSELAQLPPEVLSPRARLIMVYALCGFANLGSLGILIGGMGTMVPERRAEVVALGMRSIVSGTLATLLSGAVVGLWL